MGYWLGVSLLFLYNQAASSLLYAGAFAVYTGFFTLAWQISPFFSFMESFDVPLLDLKIFREYGVDWEFFHENTKYGDIWVGLNVYMGDDTKNLLWKINASVYLAQICFLECRKILHAKNTKSFYKILLSVMYE